MTKRLTDIGIAARIVPTMLRWPTEGRTLAWDRLRDCVDALRGLARAVDNGCAEAEQDRDLSPEGIRRRRNKLGQTALAELADLKPVKLAEKVVADNLAHLEERMVEMPKPSSTFADVMMEQEIRAFVRTQNSPIDFIMKSITDRTVLSAVLNAPVCLTGLTEAEWNLVRARAGQTLHPDETEMQKHLTAALNDVREGIAATKRALLERCEMREEDGQFRSIHEPLSSSRGAGAEAAARAAPGA